MAAAIRLQLAQRSRLRGSDIARAKAVALDVVSTVFGADVAGEHLQTALGCCVGAHGLATQLRHHGADVDNLTLTTLHHLGQYSRRHDERTYQVDVDNLLELCAFHLVHRDTFDDAGIVHKDVDVTHLGVDFLNHLFHLVFFRNIANIAVHVSDTCVSIVLQTAGKELLVDVVEDNVLDTCCNKSFSNVEANAVRRTGDEGVLTFQRKRIHDS